MVNFHLERLSLRKAAPALLVMMFILFHPVPSIAGTRAKVSADLFSASFPSAQDGWVCGRDGTILHTENGGLKWKAQASGTSYTLTSVYFTDAMQGWAVGDHGTILHTDDGGKVWRPQKSPLNTYLMSVQFVNPQTGWIVTEQTTILHTTDGGKSWAVQFKDRDFILKKVSFCDAQNGWAAGEYGFIYHTTDGGAHWTKQGGSYGISKETGALEGGTFIFDVLAINPATAWVVGIDGYVAKTTDGGATWKKVTEGIPKVHLFTICSNYRGDLIIGGEGLILVSSDGGKSFQRAKCRPSIIYGWIYDIVNRGKAGLVAVGKGGWIYAAGEQGENWHQILD